MARMLVAAVVAVGSGVLVAAPAGAATSTPEPTATTAATSIRAIARCSPRGGRAVPTMSVPA